MFLFVHCYRLLYFSLTILSYQLPLGAPDGLGALGIPDVLGGLDVLGAPDDLGVLGGLDVLGALGVLGVLGNLDTLGSLGKAPDQLQRLDYQYNRKVSKYK